MPERSSIRQTTGISSSSSQRNDAALEAKLRALIPTGERGVEIRLVKHTRAQLIEAAETTVADWSSLSDTALIELAIRQESNSIAIVVAGDVEAARRDVAAVRALKGIAVTVQGASAAPQRVPRDCYGPMRAGIRIDNDAPGSGEYCTMGFHVSLNGDEQFLTAGHCGAAYAPTDWHHYSYGLVGNETATMLTSSVARDIMRVQMLDGSGVCIRL